MIPSESCILPQPVASDAEVYRRSLFSSALEGCWTSVGHQVMVWCHQVRWRVARAALELGTAATDAERALILDEWLRDGRDLPPSARHLSTVDQAVSHSLIQEALPPGANLMLMEPTQSRVYLLPVHYQATRKESTTKFVLYVSGGSILSAAPHPPLPLSVSLFSCSSPSLSVSALSVSPSQCTALQPTTLRLLPQPRPNRPFPVPHEGADESEAVVFFEAEITATQEDTDIVAVQVLGADGRGWVVGGFVQDLSVVDNHSVHGEMTCPTERYTNLSEEFMSFLPQIFCIRTL